MKPANKIRGRLKRNGSSLTSKFSQILCPESKTWSTPHPSNFSFKHTNIGQTHSSVFEPLPKTLVSGAEAGTKSNTRHQAVGYVFTCHLTRSLSPFLESSFYKRPVWTIYIPGLAKNNGARAAGHARPLCPSIA